MSNFLSDVFDGILGIVDSAFRDGWVWYVLGGLVIFGVYCLFFVRI